MTTTVKDSNSTKNQNIKGQFIAREVFCNVNSLANYCLQKGFEDPDSPINMDEIENYYSYPEYYGEFAEFAGGTEEDRDKEIERLKELQDRINYDIIENEIYDLENLNYEPQEIYEWWAVSSHLYEKLRDLGEPVIDTGSCYVWGRTTTGQAILLDYAITQICSDMEILEGQANEW